MARDQQPGHADAAAPPGVLIRPMQPGDAGQVLAIYQAGLDTGQASFETTAPPWEAFDAARLPAHRHLAADAASGQVLGWTAAAAVSDRCVYAGVIEHSVYVHPGHHRRGIGAALLAALAASADQAGIWTIQSGSSRRTPPACACTSRPGSGSWASASGSAGITAGGVTWSSSSVAAP